MSADYFLPNPEGYISHFDEEWECLEWLEESAFAGTTGNYVGDTDHPSCLYVDPDASQDGKGVYRDFTDADASTDYVFEFAYLNASAQEIDVVIYDQTNGANIETDTLTAETWTNYRNKFTTPAGCATIRVFLRAGTDSTNKFYIDDISCQGNVLDANPESYRKSYPANENKRKTLNGNIVEDKTSVSVNLSMFFNRLSHAEFEKLLDLHLSNTETWLDDCAVRQGKNEEKLYTETTYNYSGITNPSSTDYAYNDASSSEPSAVGDFETTEFATADYQAVDGDDATYAEDTASSTGHYLYHKFKIDISGEYTAADQIRTLSIEYKGSANDASSSDQDGVVLYLWNVDSGHWAKVDQSRSSSKETLSFSTTKASTAQKFVDTSTGYVRALVQTQNSKGSGTALSLQSYWIQAIINRDQDDTVDLTNKAVLDSDDDVVQVKNKTQRLILQKGIDYSIEDDRESVIADGAFATLTGSEYFSGGNVLNTTVSDIFISLWIRTTDTATKGVVCKATALSGVTGYVFFITSGKMYFRMVDTDSDAFVIRGNTEVNDGDWHHVAVTVDRNNADNCKIYRDGADDTYNNDGAVALAAAAESLANAENFCVGAESDGDNKFIGSIADVKIQFGGTQPTATQIAYQAAYPRDYKSLAWTVGGTHSYWSFDDAASAANADADGMITDGSGTGNSLDAVGGTTTNFGTHVRDTAIDSGDTVEVTYEQHYRIKSATLQETHQTGQTISAPPREASLDLVALIGLQ